MRPASRVRTDDLLLVSGLIGLAGILCVALWEFQVSSDAALAGKLEDYDRLRSVAAYETELNKLTADGTSSPLAGLVVDGSTASEASAGILLSLSRHPAASGVQILRTAELPVQNLGAVLTAGQSIEFSGGWPAILQFIAAIESHIPELAILRLTIRAPFDRDLPPDAEPVYTVEVQIQGITGITPPSQDTEPR